MDDQLTLTINKDRDFWENFYSPEAIHVEKCCLLFRYFHNPTINNDSSKGYLDRSAGTYVIDAESLVR